VFNSAFFLHGGDHASPENDIQQVFPHRTNNLRRIVSAPRCIGKIERYFYIIFNLLNIFEK